MVLQTLTAQKGKFVTHSERHELDGQRLVAHHAGVSHLVFNPLFRLQHPDDGDALGAFLEQRPEEQSRVKCTEAEVRAEAEGEVRIGLSVKSHFARSLKRRFILVGRPQNRDTRPPALTVTP